MPFLPSLQGTLSGENLTPQDGGDSPLGDNMDMMGGMMGFRQDQANEPPPKIKMETDEKGQPKWSVDLSDSQMKGIMGKMSYLEKALQAMSGEAERLKAQEQRTRQNPLLSVLTQVAGNLAVTDKRLPPLVAALGRSSLALNPTPDQLSGQRMGLEQEIGKGAATGAQLEMGLIRENRLERRMDADTQERLKADNAQVFRTLGSDAQKGLLTDPKITAQVLKNTGVKDDVAESQATQLVAVSQAKRGLDAAAAQAKDAQEQRALKERAREADQHMATILTASQIHTDTAMKLNELKQQEAEKKATLKDDAARKKIPATLPDSLRKLTAAEKSLDEVEAGLKKYSKYQGIVAGRLLEPVGAYVKTDVAQFFNKIRIQVAQVIASTGAGARGFGPMERSYFEKLAESKNHSPAENLGIINSWRDYLKQQRKAYFETFEGLQDPKWKKAFGKDADEVFQSLPDAGGEVSPGGFAAWKKKQDASQ